MKLVVFEARENVEMIVEGVLTTCWLVVLEDGSTVALISFLHGDGDLFGDIENVESQVGWKIVEIFVVIVWDHDDVAGIIFDPKRIDEGGDEFVDVDDVGETQKSIFAFYPTHS